MSIYDGMLKDIVDAYRMKDSSIMFRKIKKADEFYQKIDSLRKKTSKKMEERTNDKQR